MPEQVSEKQARQVAEDAREAEWKQPSFGKELFMGDLRLDLIHPQPKLDPERGREGRGLPRQAARLPRRTRSTRLQIERDARIPEHVIEGLKEIGAFGMKVPEEYGGLGLSQVYYNRALTLVGRLACRALHAALGAPVDRPRRAAAAVRLRGAEAGVAAEGRADPRIRLPAHRARRGLGPGAPRHHRDPHRGRLATSSTAASCGPPTARSPTWSSSWPRCRRATATEAASAPSSCPTTPRASRSSTATSSWACGGSRTRSRCSRRARPEGEPDRQGGRRA